jgi:hypothetical protein
VVLLAVAVEEVRCEEADSE